MRPIVSASWTGLFLFAVGLYGGYYLPLTRYLTLAGTIPLDWFYFTLVVGGGLLAIASEEWTALQEIE
ncbi:MAG: hypothetical protein VKP62_01180, partial [Candidatus Sericytochromatia bacterium]|nr:hypothetical protein [Candidatus Sericytochromatia bacterium]